MVKSCSAINCTNRYGKLTKDGKKLPFHRFPLHNIDLLKKWVAAFKNKDWKLTRTALLCGEHFLETDYRTPAHCFLKPDAVPSIFSTSKPPRKNSSFYKQIPPPISNELKCPDDKATVNQAMLERSTLQAHEENNAETSDDKLTPHVENQTVTEQNPSPISNQLKCPDGKATTLNGTTPQNSTLQALLKNNTESRDDKMTPHVEKQTLSPSPVSNQPRCLVVKPIIINHITPQCSTLQVPVVRNNPATPDKLTPHKINHTVPEQNPSTTSNQLKGPEVKATALDLASHQTLSAGTLPDDGLTPSARTKMLQKKVKVLQARLRRRDKKIAKLESTLLMAQKCCSKSSDTSEILKETYGDFQCEILMNMLSNKSKKPGAHRYSKPIMEFAATLYYNSPRIYNFLRSKLSLPHSSYIRSKDIVASSEEDTEEPYVSPVIIPIKKE